MDVCVFVIACLCMMFMRKESESVFLNDSESED